VTGASVSTIELGNQNPTAKFIVKASKILKVPLQELVDLQNEDLYGLTKAAEIEDLLTSTDVLRHIEKTKSILGEAILRLQFCEERLMDDKKSQPEIK
jgi:transcriptional regulator with XRE-family HTH domain